jgi:hypothetical protein
VTVLWPRLVGPIAKAAFSSIVADGNVQAAMHHPDQIYASIGGRRATTAEIRSLIEATTAVAESFGYPGPGNDGQRIGFDRAVAKVVRDAIDISWAEAGNREVWSFVSIVALPHLTMWRFGSRNAERWVATDLTRHTWARLWWQDVVFGRDPQLLPLLAESDLNQLLERRSIGGDARLVRAIASAVLEQVGAGAERRPLFRSVTARVRRRLAFIEPRAMSEQDLLEMCRHLTAESIDSSSGTDVSSTGGASLA